MVHREYALHLRSACAHPRHRRAHEVHDHSGHTAHSPHLRGAHTPQCNGTRESRVCTFSLPRVMALCGLQVYEDKRNIRTNGAHYRKSIRSVRC